MLRKFAAALVATALIGGPAFAQSNGTSGAMPAAPATQTAPAAPMASTPAAEPSVKTTTAAKHTAKHVRHHASRSKKSSASHQVRHAKPKTVDELRAGMLAVHKNLPFTLACGSKAYDALSAEAQKLGVADAAKVVAAGYCAGGGYVLEQARAGADFKALVVFHGTNPNPVVAGTPCNIKGRVLAIHGSADPVTPKPMMDAFEDELTKAKVDWQVMMFGPPAVHSFCDPTAKGPATQYDEKLCRKAYMLMRDFFAETL